MTTPKFKCKNCGYKGSKLIFQFNDYGYCIASNEEEPDYVTCKVPKWVKRSGDAEIGEPIGCPKCHAWGVDNFEIIK